jgi:hypothetical protein
VRRSPSAWPIVLLSLPAFVSVWSGWVGLGRMTGFGEVDLLPGLADVRLNTSVTLPIGAEVLGVIAARAWLDPRTGDRARRFAFRLLWLAAGYGAAGQAAYHLMTAAGWSRAPWPVTVGVSVMPVGVLMLGLILLHLVRTAEEDLEIQVEEAAPVEVEEAASPAWDGDRAALVEWLRAQDPRPTDRALGARFGRSRSWGARLLRDAAGQGDHGADNGEDGGLDKAGRQPMAAQATASPEQAPVAPEGGHGDPGVPPPAGSAEHEVGGDVRDPAEARRAQQQRRQPGPRLLVKA